MKALHLASVLLVSLALVLTGCNKDDELMAHVNTISNVTDAIVAHLEETEDKAQGLQNAREHFDENRAELEEALAAVGQFRGYQVSDEVMEEAMGKVVESLTTMSVLNIRYRRQVGEENEAALTALVDDFNTAAARLDG